MSKIVGSHQIFSTSGLPSSPVGLNSRIRMSRLNDTTSLYSPLTEQTIVHVNPTYVRNKNIMYGCFGSTFLLCAIMLSYQIAATQNITQSDLGYNKSCSEHIIINTSVFNSTFDNYTNSALDILGLDMLIMIVPCLVFAFFNFLRICIF